MTVSTAVALATLLAGPSDPPRHVPDPVHVLIILADDMGTEMMRLYGRRGSNPALYPPTPNLDALAARGVIFNRAWVNPTCSPTRATINTGRYAFRNGIGKVIAPPDTIGLVPAVTDLPKVVLAQATAAFGKWHLATSGSNCHPTGDIGWGYFEGHLFEQGFVYVPSPLSFPMPVPPVPPVGTCNSWSKIRSTLGGNPCSITVPSTAYLTCDIMDAAKGWLAARSGSWLCYLAPEAPYELLHTPPSTQQTCCNGITLHSETLTAPPMTWAGYPNSGPQGASAYEKEHSYFAALEAFDEKVGEVLASLSHGESLWWQNTTVFFLGDNGTPGIVNNANGFWTKGAKGTLYEGGVNVPFIVAGKGVTPRGVPSEAFVNGVDVYATAVDYLNGTPTNQTDGKSLRPILQGPFTSVRNWVYTEKFAPNFDRRFDGGLVCANHEYAIAADIAVSSGTKEYKLIRRHPGASLVEELYQVQPGRIEGSNLVPPGGSSLLTGDALIAYNQLMAYLASDPSDGGVGVPCL